MKFTSLQQLILTLSFLTPFLLSSQDYAYVCNRDAASVSVIRLSDDSVVATITVGEAPNSIAVAPNGLYAYVVNTGSQSVSKIDSLTQTVVTTIPLLGLPDEIAITPDGAFAYVTDPLDDVVFKIHISTDNHVTTIGASLGPAGLVVNNAGSVVFIANNSIAAPSYLNVETNALTAGPTLVAMEKIYLNPSGTEAYLFTEAHDQIYVCSASTTLELQTIIDVTNPTGMAFTPNGSSYFGYVVSSDGPTLVKYDLSGPTLISLITLPNTSFQIATTSDGLYAYVTGTSMGSGVVNKIDLTNISFVGTITVGDNPQAIATLSLPPVSPPSNFQGNQYRDESGIQYSLVNHLSWEPVSNTLLLGYNIYRNGTLITRVSPTTTNYDEYLINRGATTQYSITCVSIGYETPSSTISVP